MYVESKVLKQEASQLLNDYLQYIKMTAETWKYMNFKNNNKQNLQACEAAPAS